MRVQYGAPASCPDAESFATQLRERTQRGRLAEPNELARTFSVTLAADAQGFSGEVEFLDESGAKVNRRVHGEQCEAVVSSLALITALALDATLRSEDGEGVPASAPPDPPRIPQVSPAPIDATHASPTRVTQRGLRAVLVAVGARERARLWPNSSLSSRFSGSAAQFCATNILSCRCDWWWIAARDQLLAGAGLALDAHRRAGVDHALELREQRLHRRRVADDVVERASAPCASGTRSRRARAPRRSAAAAPAWRCRSRATPAPRAGAPPRDRPR